MSNKHIYIIYTGGTIGMEKTPSGYTPAPGLLEKHLSASTEINHDKMPSFTVNEFAPLIDSSDITPPVWSNIAQTIFDNYQKYDGFIVLHGTDTMAYTASALSFMLQNIDKPIIVTGAQIPISEVRNDALRNVKNSLFLASEFPIHEVCLYFHDYLLRGNRSRKVDAERLQAFTSPNFPALAEIGIQVNVKENLLLPLPKAPIQFSTIQNPRIAAIRLFPGFSTTLLTDILNEPLDGLILETYGSGNAPQYDQALIKAIKQATEKGVIIVNCTQCLYGRVNMQQYATGNALYQAGVISAYDMTPEAALTKLLYLFSQKYPHDIIRTKMMTNLCGEMTIKDN